MRFSFKSIICFQLVVCSLYWCEGCLDEERRLLLQIKDSTGYRKHIDPLVAWVGENCCEWPGVLCQTSSNSSSHVVSIYLEWFTTEGPGTWYPNASLFAQFEQLESLSMNQIGGWWVEPQGSCGMRNLKSLDIRYNNLDDEQIPSCLLTNSSKLKDLYLDGNNLRSLDGFARIKSLRTLSLGWNRLNESNSLPELCKMGNLKSLFLSGNNLDDEHIPSCLLTYPSKLEVLYLDHNNLRSLNKFAQMKNLRMLRAWSNRLNESFNSLSGICEMGNLKNLDLSYNNLDDGDIPPCFFANLSKLEGLYLSSNNLLRLEGFQQLSNLQELDLSENQITNIGSWISNLTSLVYLSLYYNHLKDSETLKGLCSLRNLRDVDLYENSIQGQIPTCFKDMHSFRYFDLSYNQLSGSIPPSIFSNLTMIETFDVGNNQLNGVIPFFMFANLSKLSYMDLSNNPRAKVEIEHPHWTPTFQLLTLSLTRCNVSSNIPSFLSSQLLLQHFESDYSYLNGSIPPWILYNVSTSLVLSLRGNMLEGPLPESSQENPSMLIKLDISNNLIHSTLPMNFGKLLPMLVYFNASGNALQGKIPPSMGEIETLATLDLSKNDLSGEMQLGLAKNNPSLRCLVLSDNHFEGQIFARDFNASQLLIVILNNNHFTRIISQSLSNSQYLMFLDARNNKLVGTVPSWLSSLPNLVSVLLGGNSFTGHIPLDFCQMRNLHMLDLSNNFLSGSLPSCLNNVTSLLKSAPIFEFLNEITSKMSSTLNSSFTEYDFKYSVDFTTKGVKLVYQGIPLSLMTGLDFSMNRLTGAIPPKVGELQELRTLNLSNNFLTGSIPESFKSLVNIESLDLSHNKLIGLIPSQLTQLNYLSTFWVAFNNLSGKIPSGRQFDTFNASCYAGNPALCGLPTEKNCSLDRPSQPSDEEEDNEKMDILGKPILFYLWIVFSFALGFSGFALVLIFNANWRWNYFRVVDDYIDWTTRKFVLIKKWL